jgi:hypothetical protein
MDLLSFKPSMNFKNGLSSLNLRQPILVAAFHHVKGNSSAYSSTK